MSLLSTYELVNSTQFRGKLIVAIYKKSKSVLNEAGDGPRKELARTIQFSPTTQVDRFTWLAACHPSLDVPEQSIKDSDILAVVDDLWDDIAGRLTT